MAARLTGVLYTYETHVLYVGALIASARHQHHAGQVFWVPGGLVVADEEGLERRVSTHFVPPNEAHGHGAAEAAAVLWVDRDDLQWDRASKSPHDLPFEVPLRRLPGVVSATVGARPSELLAPEDAREVARALLAVVAPAHGSQGYAPRHPAVMRMCTLLDGTAPDHEISITELAQQSGLSVRQLRHRFTEELGINPRAYLRWRRMRRAIASIERGASLTEAALDGGFADGALQSVPGPVRHGAEPGVHALPQLRQRGGLRRIGGRVPVRDPEQMRAEDAVDRVKMPNDGRDVSAFWPPGDRRKREHGLHQVGIRPTLVAHERLHHGGRVRCARWQRDESMCCILLVEKHGTAPRAGLNATAESEAACAARLEPRPAAQRVK